MIARSSILLLVLAACAPATAPAPAPAPVTTPPAAAAQATVPLPPSASMGAVHWWRDSAERTAAFVQAYRWAGERLRELARGQASGGWGVIMDADETVLDNSTYQLRRGRENLGYSAESWAAWVAEKAAPATPGAAEFTRLVHELGGRVAIVTNRDDPQCPDTRENLRSAGVAADVVLCRAQGQSDKNPRFAAVEAGNGTGLPPLRVVMWVGDNIQDFPRLSQDVRTQGPAALDEFGRRFVLLPNPMYGSWERNPMQ